MLATIAVVLCIQLAVGLPAPDGYVDYSKHQVIRILPKDAQNNEDLKNLILEFKRSVDFWNHPYSDLRPVLSLLGPENHDFLVSLNKSSIKYEVVSDSFQKMIDAEREDNSKSTFAAGFDFDTKYHTYDEIKAELNTLTKDGGKATYKSVGKSYEGRDIPAIVVTNPGSTTTKETVFFECGIHAREWISTAACLYMTNQLLTNTSNDKLLDKFEFIIVPTLNVDGYVYTWETNRSWRMTRSKIPGSSCVGADPNRNWDSSWCKEGASPSPCNEEYCGPHAFSEVEVKQMSELIATRKGRIAAYFAFHSFSEFWMYPYGYTSKLPPNAQQLDQLSKIGVNAIKASHGLTFTYGNIYDVIYPASGSSIDWAYDNCGAKIAFALELRDKGTYGFVLPTTQIKPASEETWAGIRAVLEAL